MGQLICRNCRETLNECVLFALMADFGAQLSWSPSECPDGQKHEFVDIEKLDTTDSEDSKPC